MAEVTPLWVEYPADDPAAPPVVVERLSADMVDNELVRGALQLWSDSYAAQFGGIHAPKSAFREAFNPYDDGEVRRRRQIITDSIRAERADYWVVRSASPERLDGYVCIQPDVFQTYIGDVITAPPWKQGIGSRALHAALTLSSRELTSPVVLDGFEGSSVNDWYMGLGFERRGLNGYFEIGATGRQMLMREYVVPSSLGLGSIVRALEARRLQLKHAAVHHTRP